MDVKQMFQLLNDRCETASKGNCEPLTSFLEDLFNSNYILESEARESLKTLLQFEITDLKETIAIKKNTNVLPKRPKRNRKPPKRFSQ